MRWSSTRPRSAIWNWSSRCSPANPRNRRCSTCSTARAPAWAAVCCAAVCSRRRIDVAEIEARLDAVEELHASAILRAELAKDLASILDLERLLAKITLSHRRPARSAGAGAIAGRDPVAEAATCSRAEPRASATSDARLDEVAEVRDRVLAAIAEEPPVNLADGGTIRDGFDPRLDELRDISPQQPDLSRANRAARARPHRHRVAQGPLQQRLRLLHRNLQSQSAPGARRL